MKSGICAGIEILVTVDDGSGINVFYIDHVKAIRHNQKLKEQNNQNNDELIDEGKWKRIFLL
jgi:hypothetical protein